jgi:hypothetical protein
MKKNVGRRLTVLAATAALTAGCSSELPPTDNNANLPSATVFDCQAEAQAAQPLPSNTEGAATMIAKAITACFERAPDGQKDALEGSRFFDVKIADGGLLRFFSREDTANPGRILSVGASVYPNGNTGQAPTERIHIDRLLPRGDRWGMQEENRALGGLVTTAVVQNYGSEAPTKFIRNDGSQRHEALLMAPDSATGPAAERIIGLLETPVNGTSAFTHPPIGTPQ